MGLTAQIYGARLRGFNTSGRFAPISPISPIIVNGSISGTSLLYNDTSGGGGGNVHGQIGDATTVSKSMPTQIYGNHTFCEIKRSGGGGIAVDVNNIVGTWGSNTYGQIGNNTISIHQSTPVIICGNHTFCHIATSVWIMVGIDNHDTSGAGGRADYNGTGLGTDVCTPTLIHGNHTFCKVGNAGNGYIFIALDNHGKAGTGGGNYAGGLGINNLVSKGTPVEVCGGHTFCEVDSGGFHSAGIDIHGQAGSGGISSMNGDGSIIDKYTPVAVCGGHSFVKISAGLSFTAALKANGEVGCGGFSNRGELGNNDPTETGRTPVAVCGGHTFCEISAGIEFCTAMDANCTFWAGGRGTTGNLGDGTETDKCTPILICKTYMSPAPIIVNGSISGPSLLYNDVAGAGGRNTYGQMGDGTMICKAIPTEIYGNHTFCKIDRSFTGGIAVDNNNVAWKGGSNSTGQIGNNTSGNCESTPVMICGNHTFCHIAALTVATIGIDNHDQSWGGGASGSNATGLDSCTPILIHGNHTFCKIGSTGWSVGIALDNHGFAGTGGHDIVGALGAGPGITLASTPVAVCGGHTFCEVDSNALHSAGIDIHGQAWAGGILSLNGNNTNDYDIFTPVAVCGGHSFIKISVGMNFTAALKANGEVGCWGLAYQGALGNNSTTTCIGLTPVQVCGNHTFAKISAHYENCFAVDIHDVVGGWGRGDNGALGDGTITNKCVPVLVCQTYIT